MDAAAIAMHLPHASLQVHKRQKVTAPILQSFSKENKPSNCPKMLLGTEVQSQHVLKVQVQETGRHDQPTLQATSPHGLKSADTFNNLEPLALCQLPELRVPAFQQLRIATHQMQTRTGETGQAQGIVPAPARTQVRSLAAVRFARHANLKQRDACIQPHCNTQRPSRRPCPPPGDSPLKLEQDTYSQHSDPAESTGSICPGVDHDEHDVTGPSAQPTAATPEQQKAEAAAQQVAHPMPAVTNNHAVRTGERQVFCHPIKLLHKLHYRSQVHGSTVVNSPSADAALCSHQESAPSGLAGLKRKYPAETEEQFKALHGASFQVRAANSHYTAPLATTDAAVVVQQQQTGVLQQQQQVQDKQVSNISEISHALQQQESMQQLANSGGEVPFQAAQQAGLAQKLVDEAVAEPAQSSSGTGVVGLGLCIAVSEVQDQCCAGKTSPSHLVQHAQQLAEHKPQQVPFVNQQQHAQHAPHMQRAQHSQQAPQSQQAQQAPQAMQVQQGPDTWLLPDGTRMTNPDARFGGKWQPPRRVLIPQPGMRGIRLQQGDAVSKAMECSPDAEEHVTPFASNGGDSESHTVLLTNLRLRQQLKVLQKLCLLLGRKLQGVQQQSAGSLDLLRKHLAWSELERQRLAIDFDSSCRHATAMSSALDKKKQLHRQQLQALLAGCCHDCRQHFCATDCGSQLEY